METLTKDDKPRPRRNRLGLVWNILTVLVLLGVAYVTIVFLVIFINPRSAINPYPPPTRPAKITLLTPIPTIFLQPTWTSTHTIEPTVTNTPRPTATLFPSPTFFSLITPSPTLTTTPLPEGYPFIVREGSPSAIKNISHPELGCDWMGVRGQAVDMSGAPIFGLIVRLGGTLTGVSLKMPMMSLTGVMLSYGRADYEFKLADKPVASKHTLWIELLNQEGVPLSGKIYFDTYNSCDKNLIVIDFKQVR